MSLKPHTEQNRLGDRQMEGLPAAARMRSKTLCRQEPASLSKDSLQSSSEGMYFSIGSWGWVLESQNHMLHEQKACHTQLVNAKPLCRGSKKCHVHPLVVLAAEGSASTTQVSTQPLLPPCPCHLPRPAPCYRSLCNHVVPNSQNCAQSRGPPGDEVGAGKTSKLAQTPGAVSLIFPHPTAPI